MALWITFGQARNIKHWFYGWIVALHLSDGCCTRCQLDMSGIWSWKAALIKASQSLFAVRRSLYTYIADNPPFQWLNWSIPWPALSNFIFTSDLELLHGLRQLWCVVRALGSLSLTASVSLRLVRKLQMYYLLTSYIIWQIRVGKECSHFLTFSP